jgi:hypothetical protein
MKDRANVRGLYPKLFSHAHGIHVGAPTQINNARNNGCAFAQNHELRIQVHNLQAKTAQFSFVAGLRIPRRNVFLRQFRKHSAKIWAMCLKHLHGMSQPLLQRVLFHWPQPRAVFQIKHDKLT